MDFFLGFAVGLFAVAALCFLIAFITKSNQKENCYDERQKYFRSKAIQAAYAVLVVYLILYGMLNSVYGIQWFDNFTGSFIGICLSITVFAVICILNDAYVKFQEKPGQTIILFAFLSIVNLGLGFVNVFVRKSCYTNGQLNFDCINLVAGIALLIILAVFIPKQYIDKRNSTAE